MLLTIKCKGRINVLFERTGGSKKIDVNIALMKIKGNCVKQNNANFYRDKAEGYGVQQILRKMTPRNKY